MQDPLGSPPAAIVALFQPFAQRTKLLTLPFHAHEVIGAFVFYHSIFLFLSPVLSPRLASTYNSLPRRSQINWHVRVVSTIQSTLICALALYVIVYDHAMSLMGWEERLCGYTGAGGLVQAFAAGYFLWDLLISIQHFGVFGPGSLAHAVAALLITGIGFRPFANYYGLNFILYELSTPFLNIHWFLDKSNQTGTALQLVNGICLMAVFFGCRLVWGSYQSLNIYRDCWLAWTSNTTSTTKHGSMQLHLEVPYLIGEMNAPTEITFPVWLLVLYLVSNTLLSFLQFFWFGKMVEAMRKRFVPDDKKKN